MDQLDLHAVADGELAPEELARAKEFISKSPEHARELEAILALKACIRSKAEAHAAQPVWKTCVSRLDEIDKTRRVETFVGKYAWALCGLFFLIILGGGYFNRLRGASVKAGEVASMASSMISLPNPQVSAPEQVQSYIGEKVGSRPALRIDTSTIMGCKMYEEPGRKALSLLLNDHGQPLELMVVAGVDRVEGVRPMGGGMYAGNLERSNLVTWSDGGNVIVLSGDLSHEDLRTYAVSLYR